MYPSWRYHATHPAIIVRSPAEDETLGDDWSHTPATFGNQPEAPAGPITAQAQGIPSGVTDAMVKQAEESAIANALEKQRRGAKVKTTEVKSPAKT